MRKDPLFVFGLALSSLWIWPNLAPAEQDTAREEPAAGDRARIQRQKPCFEPRGTETSEEREESVLADLEGFYRAWLTEDVVYIIAPEERCAFFHLETSEEREQFVEQFWLRRSDNPESPDNDFKDEHYRRILFAIEKFSAGIPGWNTDRGHAYIVFGPPDRVESHPGGEATGKPPEEGPETTEFPWERWHYRYLEGFGADVDLDFVDPAGSGNYRLALDAEEREALFSPPSGLLFSHSGLAEVNRQHSRPSAEGATASSEESPQITIYKGPAPFRQVRYKDLEAVVTAGIIRDQVYFSHEVQFLKATHASTVVRVVFDIPEELSADKTGEKSGANYEIFARVSKPSGWVVDTIERSAEADEKSEPRDNDPDREALLALKPGTYELAIVVKDVNSGRVGVRYAPLSVPTYQELERKQD